MAIRTPSRVQANPAAFSIPLTRKTPGLDCIALLPPPQKPFAGKVEIVAPAITALISTSNAPPVIATALPLLRTADNDKLPPGMTTSGLKVKDRPNSDELIVTTSPAISAVRPLPSWV